jgi:hypothetical protein
MNKLELLFHHRRFKDLNKAYQLLSLWERWIRADMAETGDTTTHMEYIDVCIFINRYLEKNDFVMEHLPQVTDENNIAAWFEVKNNWCKDSMREFNLEDKFDIVVRQNKYVFRNLTATKK